MKSTLEVQNQIRNNAEEVSSYFADLAKWEKEIQVKDKKLRQSSNNNTQKQRSVTSNSFNDVSIVSESAARHTYDIGYKKWEKFDEFSGKV
jgi:hypothetical protein